MITPDTTPQRGLPSFYEPKTQKFYLEDAQGTWHPHALTSFRMQQRCVGISTTGQNGAPSQFEKLTVAVQNDKAVDWAGPLAGYQSGEHFVSGQRILVTNSCLPVPPVKGEWNHLKGFLETLLGHDKNQLPVLFGWLREAHQCFFAGRQRSSQALAIAGPAGCGKSLFQQILTHAWGGRIAKPYRYLIGRTDFNEEMAGSEHLSIEDENPMCDIKSRNAMGASIKNLCVNPEHSVHGKFKQAITLRPVWRLTITLNDEPYYMQVLPPLDDSIQDKLLLLQCKEGRLPFVPQSVDDFANVRKVLCGEVPGFIHHLLNEFELPEQFQNTRYGVQSYQAPDLIELIECNSLANSFISLIDSALWTIDDLTREDRWTGTLRELMALLDDTIYRAQSKVLFGDRVQTLANYIKEAARRYPERIKKQELRNNQGQQWTILKVM